MEILLNHGTFRTRYDVFNGQSSFVETFDAVNENRKHIKITTKHSPTYGKCYSIRPRTHVLKYGILVVDIVARMDIMIYLGYPGQFMYNTKTKVSTFCSICFQLFHFRATKLEIIKFMKIIFFRFQLIWDSEFT